MASRGTIRCGILAFVLAVPSLSLAQPVAVRSDARPPAASAQQSDRHDVLLLLDSGPIHLRLNVGMGGVSLAEARQKYVAQVMAALDADHDGRLTRQEAGRSPILRTKERKGAAEFLEKLKAQSTLTPRDVMQKIDAIGGVGVAYRDFPTASQNDVEVFKLLDTDASGMLDSQEMATASDLILAKDDDGDQCVAFQEFFPPAPPPDPLQVAAVAAEIPIPVVATVSTLMRDAATAETHARVLRKYNKKLDRGLAASELGWTSDRLAKLDADRNELLDAVELKGVPAATPDVEMAIDLRPVGSLGGTIDIAGGLGKRLDDASRPDYAKMSLGGVVITFSHRNLDPFASSIDSAMRQFNLLDADANGYLSEDETAERIRFVRDLFGLMDTDDDKKVFADEMKEYVRARAEPAASTCRVNIYDTGNGFFMALDSNADGRVSVREVRKAAASLAQLDRDGQPGVGQEEPVRHFHIEFVRGSYNLFGPSEQLLAQTPAFQQRTPTGPIWFQRMDRNNDGDLTWNEFLGPRYVYHQLDGDHDDLLDPNEAGKAR
jgi:Ca2+-binding EF-hand superfamily protein